MRYVATTAAVFGAAIVWTAGSHASILDARSLHNIINKPAIAASAQIQPRAALASKQTNPVKDAQPVPAEHSAPIAEAKSVTVSDGDNLTKLADSSGVSYQRLYDANPVIDNPDLIMPGQELKVPASDENLASRPLPVNAPVATVQATQSAASSGTSVASRSSSAVQSQPSTAAAVADGSVWDQLAACESGGNWTINNGNGYYGGIQFTLSTWQGLGGSGLPSDASREEQISRAQMLQARSGWGQWPACAAKLGLL